MAILSDDTKLSFVIGVVGRLIWDGDITPPHNLGRDDILLLGQIIVDHIDEHNAFSSIMALNLEDHKVIMFPLVTSFLNGGGDLLKPNISEVLEWV